MLVFDECYRGIHYATLASLARRTGPVILAHGLFQDDQKSKRRVLERRNSNKNLLHSTIRIGHVVTWNHGAFFLWTEHRAHLLGALPYVIFLLCPLIHLFMHRGHGKNGGHHGS